jgi:hypothetical protein
MRATCPAHAVHTDLIEFIILGEGVNREALYYKYNLLQRTVTSLPLDPNIFVSLFSNILHIRYILTRQSKFDIH